MHFCAIFDVAYRVAGDRELRLHNVTIGPSPPFAPRAASPLKLSPEAPYWHQSHRQLEEFKTGTYYWFYAEAEDYDSLVRYASDDVDPVVSLALSYHAGFEVATQLVSVYETATRHPVTVMTSATFREVVEHSPDEEFLESVLVAAAFDETVLRASRLLCQGRRMFSAAAAFAASEDTLRGAAVLQYARALETLVDDKRVPTSPKDDASVIAQKERAIAKLVGLLSGSRVLNGKVSAVNSAHVELGRAGNRYLDLKLQVLARELSLSSTWLASAKELIKLRNQRIAHGGRGGGSSASSAPFQIYERVVEDAILGFIVKYTDASAALANRPERGSSFPDDRKTGHPMRFGWGSQFHDNIQGVTRGPESVVTAPPAEGGERS